MAKTPPQFSRSSRGRLTTHDLARFPDDTLFDRIGRVVCEAGCLPRTELYESWELGRRARRLCQGGRVVDPAIPHSARAMHESLVTSWPRLAV